MSLLAPSNGRRMVIAGLAVACFSLWVRSAVPVHGIASAGDDDALFVELARHLGAGEWLGPFDNRTLVKGMGYPLFILAAFVVGVPLKLAEQAVYLGAAALLAGAVAARSGRAWPAFILFAALALNPLAWGGAVARVTREGLYLGLSPAVLGLVLLAGFAPQEAARGGPRLAWGAAAGLAAAAFWLTREEGVWLAPSLAIVAFGAVLDARRRPAGRGSGLAALVAPAAAAVALFLAVLTTVAALNARHYGAFVDNEVKSAPFRKAYGALARITPDHWEPYVVFPRDARLRAYAASAAARELAPTFEGALGEGWRATGCDQTGRAPCPEILAGWFQWALRDAVAAAGHYGSARQAAQYYDRLAGEIDDACDRASLACGPASASLAPPFRTSFLRDAAARLPALAALVLRPGVEGLGSGDSVGLANQNDAFADMVGPIAPVSGRWLLRGAVVAAGPPLAAIRARDNATFSTTTDLWREPRPVDRPGQERYGFSLVTDCPLSSCDLVVQPPGAAPVVVGLIDLAARAPVNLAAPPALDVRVSAMGPDTLRSASAHRSAFILRLAAPLAWLYAQGLPVAAALAVIGLGLALWRGRASVLLVTLTLASATAVASRVVLLAYLDATAIPSVNGMYVSPATPFAIAFAVAGCALGASALSRRS